ncbi:MAG: hypothetical protein ACI96M_001546, partial [Candidatus Azotimanducaceae bacterium]
SKKIKELKKLVEEPGKQRHTQGIPQLLKDPSFGAKHE